MAKELSKSLTINRTILGFVFAFFLLLIGNIFLYLSTKKVSEQSKSVSHTNEVIQNLEEILTYTTVAISSFRGYVIDQDEFHLIAFNRYSNKADSTVQLIKDHTKESPTQQSNINIVSNLVDKIIKITGENLADFKGNRVIDEKIKAGAIESGKLKSELQEKISQMQKKEEELGNIRTKEIGEYIDLIKLISVISTVIAIFLTLFSILIFNKEYKAKQEADRQADRFREQLENRVAQLADMNAELIELRSLEKFTATGRIARTIAHEVRNPLTNINLAVEQLKTEFEGSANADIFLDMISRNSVRINKLVSDLLHATKLNEVEKTPESINEIMDECLKDAADRIQLSHINIVKNYDQHICKVSVDKEKIKIALLNLIVNGIEAMNDGGTLTITTLEEKGKCTILISDTGTGMSKEQLTRLFEPFFTTKKTGNGLGLPNVHNIILSHNGSIQCESEEGKGTTFTITLEFA